MKRPSPAQLIRLLTLTVLVGCLLLVGFEKTEWATVARAQGGTLETPGPTNTRTPRPPQPPGDDDDDDDDDDVQVATPTSIAPTLVPSAATPTPAPGSVTSGSPTTVPPTGEGCPVIVVDIGDVAENGTITIITVPLETLPNRSPRYVYIRACEVTFTNAAGVLVPNYPFAGPVDACFTYSEADLARARNNPAALLLVYYDPVTQQWVEMAVTIDPTTRQICGRLPQAAIVALVVRADPVVQLPNTSGNMPDATASPAAVAVVAAAATSAPAIASPTAVAVAAVAEAAGEPAGEAAAPQQAAAAAPNTAVEQPLAPAVAESQVGGLSLQSPLILLLVAAAVVGALILMLSRRMISNRNDGEA